MGRHWQEEGHPGKGRTHWQEGVTLARGGHRKKRDTLAEEDTLARGAHTKKRDILARGEYIHKGRKTDMSKPKAQRRHDKTRDDIRKITRQRSTTAQKSAIDTRHPA
jgi:hypothetical protein